MSEQHKYTGSCQCGNVSFTLTLPKPLNTFTPRACDCDYCTSHGAMYVSHPLGNLSFNSKTIIDKESQGSRQAIFHKCRNCHQLIGVSCNIDGQERGTINANLLDNKDVLKAAVPVSPKLLNAEEKLTVKNLSSES